MSCRDRFLNHSSPVLIGENGGNAMPRKRQQFGHAEDIINTPCEPQSPEFHPRQHHCVEFTRIDPCEAAIDVRRDELRSDITAKPQELSRLASTDNPDFCIDRQVAKTEMNMADQGVVHYSARQGSRDLDATGKLQRKVSRGHGCSINHSACQCVQHLFGIHPVEPSR